MTFNFLFHIIPPRIINFKSQPKKLIEIHYPDMRATRGTGARFLSLLQHSVWLINKNLFVEKRSLTNQKLTKQWTENCMRQ